MEIKKIWGQLIDGLRFKLSAREVFYLLILVIVSLPLAALMAYVSSMIILLFQLTEHGFLIMKCVFVVAAFCLFVGNFDYVRNLAKKHDEPNWRREQKKQRNYFEEGRFY